VFGSHDFELATSGTGQEKLRNKHKLVGIPLLNVTASSHGEKSDRPLLSDAVVESMIVAPRDWCPYPSYTSCLRVRGNSMAPLIQDGFVVAVDSSEIDSGKLEGKVVIASHKDIGLTISRFRRFDHTEVLQPDNAAYPPTILSARHSWKIVGKVLWWIGRENQKPN
jgi:SOS-response transcriptional repressor LexA